MKSILYLMRNGTDKNAHEFVSVNLEIVPTTETALVSESAIDLKGVGIPDRNGTVYFRLSKIEMDEHKYLLTFFDVDKSRQGICILAFASQSYLFDVPSVDEITALYQMLHAPEIN